ncbi:MAG TPA: hypothetical protein VGJ26_06855 [Pirellulales bacterium]|jgi:hypothetical protein
MIVATIQRVARTGVSFVIARLAAPLAVQIAFMTLLFAHAAAAEDKVSALPVVPKAGLFRAADWLLDAADAKAGVYRTADNRSLVLDNGLVRRTIRLGPNGATIGLDDLRTGASLLRSVRPEALVTIDGKEWSVGGLRGQPNQAFLLEEWLDKLTDEPSSFGLVGFRAASVEKPLEWKRTRHAEDRPWPPRGAALLLDFAGRDPAVKGVTVTIRYEIYDGIPVIGKSLTVTNKTDRPIKIDSLAVEVLAAVEGESSVDTRDVGQWRRPPIDVLSDYMFHGMDAETANVVAHWEADPGYKTQVSYGLQTPCLLVCRPPIGPGVTLQPGASLDSFRVYLIAQDSTERERQGLTVRRVWRTLAPWTTENPLMMHVRSANQATFRAAVDQCATVGFEMIIYTFGSGLQMENTGDDYIARIKADVDYAHGKGIQVGGYSLFSSRRIDDANDVINPATGKPGGAIFGNAPCFGSKWGQEYERKLKDFIARTGFDLLEHDGPYPGDRCASTTHPGHNGLEDSQWTQWETSKQLYSWCRERGVYVNQPDCYFLVGGSKTGMGYRETNWSLPRDQQMLHARQHIFDGTWNKTPSIGWMFVPLSEYHGGGAAATIEPLDAHRDDYQRHLQNALGAGVQACYRGARLYDTEATRELVTRWVAWFKKHRAILESDVIHARRADGRDVDYLVHVNPALSERALAVIYNPLPESVARTIRLPLYYTGLSGVARLRREDGAESEDVRLDAAGRAVIDVTVPPRGMTWLVIDAAPGAE